MTVRRSVRLLLSGVALVAVVAGGCGPSKEESTPNKDLQVPDIPSGKRETPGMGGKTAPKDKDKK